MRAAAWRRSTKCSDSVCVCERERGQQLRCRGVLQLLECVLMHACGCAVAAGAAGASCRWHDRLLGCVWFSGWWCRELLLSHGPQSCDVCRPCSHRANHQLWPRAGAGMPGACVHG